jgi:hypothetical protein
LLPETQAEKRSANATIAKFFFVLMVVVSLIL